MHNLLIYPIHSSDSGQRLLLNMVCVHIIMYIKLGRFTTVNMIDKWITLAGVVCCPRMRYHWVLVWRGKTHAETQQYQWALARCIIPETAVSSHWTIHWNNYDEELELYFNLDVLLYTKRCHSWVHVHMNWQIGICLKYKAKLAWQHLSIDGRWYKIQRFMFNCSKIRQ